MPPPDPEPAPDAESPDGARGPSIGGDETDVEAAASTEASDVAWHSDTALPLRSITLSVHSPSGIARFDHYLGRGFFRSRSPAGATWHVLNALVPHWGTLHTRATCHWIRLHTFSTSFAISNT